MCQFKLISPPQAAKFSFPPNSKYSKDLHKLIRYILTPNPDLRPDIYQVSHLAFGLAGRTCNVQNLHVGNLNIIFR